MMAMAMVAIEMSKLHSFFIMTMITIEMGELHSVYDDNGNGYNGSGNKTLLHLLPAFLEMKFYCPATF